MKNYIYSISVIFFFFINSILLGQSVIKKGVKFGLELNNYLSVDTGTFGRSLNLFFGAFTTVNICSFQNSSILLRPELNYSKLHHYNPGTIRYNVDTTDINWNGLNYSLIDEKYKISFIEIGLIPEYQIRFSDIVLLELFIGPSIGFSSENYETKQLDKNIYSYETDAPSLLLPISLNYGITLYYKIFLLELRFRINKLKRYNDFTNVYLQLGLAF